MIIMDDHRSSLSITIVIIIDHGSAVTVNKTTLFWDLIQAFHEDFRHTG